MGVVLLGPDGQPIRAGGATFGALRVESRPLDYGALGSFRKGLRSGTMAAALAANAEIMQFRWTSAARFAVIQRVMLDGAASGATGFTAGLGIIDMVPARAWTVDGSGGTAGTTTGNVGKLRTSMASSMDGGASGAMRISSTAALGAGTKTLDTDAMASLTFGVGTAAFTNLFGQVVLFGEDIGPQHPLVLAQNEGFVLRATVPATGVWSFGATVLWTEVAAY
jgi:hypothetical protein